jgi:hypothetical protein
VAYYVPLVDLLLDSDFFDRFGQSFQLIGAIRSLGRFSEAGQIHRKTRESSR